MSELNDITAEVLSLIKNKYDLSSTIINLWFDKLTLVSLSEEKAVFKTPTPLKQKILKKQYYSTVSEALSEVIGFEVDIDFILDDEAMRNVVIDEVSFNDDVVEESQEDKDERVKNISSLVNDTLLSQNQKILSEYTFENFIEGASNKFARAACYAVAKEPTYYNPLFIYGHSGLGKTHLLYAVINYIKENHPNLKIVYKRSEDFVNELIEAIENTETAAFKEKYRTADVLLIDDIQFISGKVATQEEFFHTFNNLYEDHKQIILTSDRPPRDMKTLEDRLKTRFEWGLIADIQPPDLELRIAIIKKKAEQVGITLAEDVLTFLAENLRSNIRQIEGAIKKLGAKVFLSGQVITMEIARSCIIELLGGEEPVTVTVDKIYTAIYRKYGITKEELESSRRTREIAMARHICIYLIHSITDMSLKSIGKLLNRDHSTIISSCDIVEKKMITDPIMRLDIEQMTEEVTGSK
jgi:chromosomal replication initiator protein